MRSQDKEMLLFTPTSFNSLVVPSYPELCLVFMTSCILKADCSADQQAYEKPEWAVHILLGKISKRSIPASPDELLALGGCAVCPTLDLFKYTEAV